MLSTKNNKNNKQPLNRKNTNKSPSTLSIRFKGMILKSLFEKHRSKQLKCIKQIFYKWYIKINQHQICKQIIDRFLISQNQQKFTSGQFFYKLKYLVRKQLNECQNQCQNGQNKECQNQQHIEQTDEQYQPQEFPFQIDQHQDNHSQYFQSLHHLLISKKNIISSYNQFQFFSQQQIDILKNFDQIMNNKQHNSQFIQNHYKENKELRQKIIQLGHKVGFILIRSIIKNRNKLDKYQGFKSINQFWYEMKMNEKYTINKQEQQRQQQQIKVLYSNPSCHSISSYTSSHESQFLIPSLTLISNQISSVQYSLNLLTQNISQHQQSLQLCTKLQNHYIEYEEIYKQFGNIRIQEKYNLFRILQKIQKNQEKQLVKIGFRMVKYVGNMGKDIHNGEVTSIRIINNSNISNNNSNISNNNNNIINNNNNIINNNSNVYSNNNNNIINNNSNVQSNNSNNLIKKNNNLIKNNRIGRITSNSFKKHQKTPSSQVIPAYMYDMIQQSKQKSNNSICECHTSSLHSHTSLKIQNHNNNDKNITSKQIYHNINKLSQQYQHTDENKQLFKDITIQSIQSIQQQERKWWNYNQNSSKLIIMFNQENVKINSQKENQFQEDQCD